MPRVIETVVEAAGLSEDDAYVTFNMGIGFALVVSADEAPRVAGTLRDAGERVYEIGEIVEGTGKVVYAG